MPKNTADNSVQIGICQKPDFYYNGESPKGLEDQQFCATCERYQFKKNRCRIFAQGCRVHKESNFFG
jgi:hypothetical protein